MKRVAIVTSYNEDCGIAYHSRCIIDIFKEMTDVKLEVVPLPVSLLCSQIAIQRKLGDKQITELASKLGQYDAVFVQFEPGLYGLQLNDIYSRLDLILSKVKQGNLIVHSYTPMNQIISWRQIAWRFARLKIETGIKAALFGFQFKKEDKFWRTFAKKHKNISILTLNLPDEKYFRTCYNISNVNTYPIVYFTENKIAQFQKDFPREKTLKQYGLDPNKKYLGVFGFLSPYKGHLTVIKALEYLDDGYEVVIVGAEHPRGLTANTDISGYVQQLLHFSEYNPEDETGQVANDKGYLSLLKKEETLFEDSSFKHFMPKKYIGERVKFVGAPTDEEMPAFFNAMDYVILPYIQTSTGQAASGPAAFALEFRCKTLFSNASVFRNLEHFYRGGMNFFNVGNFKELALKVDTYSEKEEVIQANLAKALETYNPAGMIKAFTHTLDFDIEVKK